MESTTKVYIVFLVLCVAYQVNADVNCTAQGAGRHADPEDTTCKNYTLCIYISSNNSYIYYNYSCPSTSLYNPNTGACSANYTCTVTNTTSTNSTSSVCAADGYIADPSSTDCSSYIECVEISGTFIETTYSCPNGTYFNPNTTLCESTYTCTNTFTCSTAGRFADTSDTTCKTYYYCVYNDGTYIQYNYTCPSTSVFSPTTNVCTTSYTCTT